MCRKRVLGGCGCGVAGCRRRCYRASPSHSGFVVLGSRVITPGCERGCDRLRIVPGEQAGNEYNKRSREHGLEPEQMEPSLGGKTLL